jgi:hypothetical protein
VPAPKAIRAPRPAVTASEDDLEILPDDELVDYELDEPLPARVYESGPKSEPAGTGPPIGAGKKRRFGTSPPRRRSYAAGSNGRGGAGILWIGLVTFGLIASFVLFRLELGNALSMLTGFSSRSELEQFIEEDIALARELSAVALSVHDRESALSAVPRAHDVLDRYEAHYRRAEGKKALKIDLNAVNQKYKDEKQAAFAEVQGAFARLRTIRGADAFIASIWGKLMEVQRLEQRLMAQEK